MSDGQVNATVENEKPENQTVDPSDKLTPEHPRFKEVLNRAKTAEEKTAQLEQQLAQLQEQIAERQERTGEVSFTDEEEKALERIAKGLEKRGFAKMEQVKETSFQTKLERQLEKMNEKYDGSNGLPKFVADEVFAYAKRKGLTDDLEGAYRLMHYDTILDAEARKRSSGPKPPSSERPTSSDRNGANIEVSPTDISNMSDDEWERQRTKILAGLRGR